VEDVDSTQEGAHFMTRKERSWGQLRATISRVRQNPKCALQCPPTTPKRTCSHQSAGHAYGWFVTLVSLVRGYEAPIMDAIIGSPW